MSDERHQRYERLAASQDSLLDLLELCMHPAVGDGTLDEPGRYAIMCFIPTGVEPAEYLAATAETEEGPPQIAGAGPPHFVHGMFAELTVE